MLGNAHARPTVTFRGISGSSDAVSPVKMTFSKGCRPSTFVLEVWLLLAVARLIQRTSRTSVPTRCTRNIRADFIAFLSKDRQSSEIGWNSSHNWRRLTKTVSSMKGGRRCNKGRRADDATEQFCVNAKIQALFTHHQAFQVGHCGLLLSEMLHHYMMM